MGRTECTFFQRGNVDSQQAHEKVLNITNHSVQFSSVTQSLGKCKSNHNEVSLEKGQNGYH